MISDWNRVSFLVNISTFKKMEKIRSDLLLRIN